MYYSLVLIHICTYKYRLQIPYLVQFGIFVGKNRVVIPLGVVVIHKHESITTGNETPLFA